MALLERYERADEGMSTNDLANVYRIDAARSLVNQMLERGYLAEKTVKWYYGSIPDIDRDTVKYSVSADGRDYLRMCRNIRQYYADYDNKLILDNAKNRRTTFKQGFIIAIIGPILTLIIEHWAEIVAFIKHIFVK